MRFKKFTLSVVFGICFALMGLLSENAVAQDKKDMPGNTRGFPDLVGGLKATEGCLGVETAQTSSGKQCIFAWFQNKKAVLNWYYGHCIDYVFR